MDKPLPPLPNAAALRGSDAGLSSVPDSAQQSQRPLVQIADADYEYTRCRFTHSLCVPLTALRSRLRCPRCRQNNAFGLQLAVFGSRVLQKAAVLVQLPANPVHRPRITWECCNCSSVRPSNLRFPETKTRGCLPLLFTSVQSPPTSTHSVLMQIARETCYGCGHPACSDCDHFMCRDMEVEDREAKVYLTCMSDRGRTQRNLFYETIKLQQRGDAQLAKHPVHHSQPAFVPGLDQVSADRGVILARYTRHRVFDWLDNIEDPSVQPPELVHLADIRNGRPNISIQRIRAETSHSPSFI